MIIPVLQVGLTTMVFLLIGVVSCTKKHESCPYTLGEKEIQGLINIGGGLSIGWGGSKA